MVWPEALESSKAHILYSSPPGLLVAILDLPPPLKPKHKVTNEEVLERVNIQNYQLMNNIRKLKLTYFGHVKRHNTLEKLCMEGMVEGKRGRGRPKRRWSEDVAEW
ncbi:eukaryotic translation initiation factor 3 subunit F [Elysia marginata]|uniref:Eukaryotic translation initiation factor 3 subunit F n=1 Tax=Elysia marginata TaxID=1093978 RepID=A0AAV4EDX4_9GAST|nr:eukaryotic translation initiation factor 3 subunit F [Elysia marginata]